MHEVFINYRTGDGEKTAGTLATALSHRFGNDAIFHASSTIPPGSPYPKYLLNGVRGCAVLLAVVGPAWSRHPGLHDESDWVRREILEALSAGKPVIPILDGRKTDRLNPADLPAELARLAEMQSVCFDLHDAQAGLTRIGNTVATRVPSLKALERSHSEEGGTVTNSTVDVHGTVIQNRDVLGDAIGTVVHNMSGQLHTGKGNNYRYDNSPHFSGDGGTNITGDHHGSLGHRFGGSRGDRDDDR
ncbi:toll/interleukin-1 receptor domain-containing protein [Rhizohabitans arisaemae]|uniref:toll/interleukin-1 receptor domain-containing protein n=1 Tax=Rhizohabitans arisaemae TaxID=2720610 RepID=UPI0024B175D7|nr:toll/interleukin-1 receptor domain-containing protein [Rhizohabitans arisaemae]